jgi:hypothetical protein
MLHLGAFMSVETFKPPVNKWHWRVLGPPPQPKKPMSMKVKALIQAPIMALVGGLIYWYFDHLIGPVIIWTLAGVVLVGGLFVPPMFRAIEHFGLWLGKWVAIILNWGLLTPFFYLCFAPGRLILKLKGHDPMDRAFPDARESFWIPRKPITDFSQYRKQH